MSIGSHKMGKRTRRRPQRAHLFGLLYLGLVGQIVSISGQQDTNVKIISSNLQQGNMSSLFGQQTLMTNTSLANNKRQQQDTNRTLTTVGAKTGSGSGSSVSARQNQTGGANSPAVNSRLKQAQPAGRMATTMTAEGSHDSQSFVTINSGPTVVGASPEKSAQDGARARTASTKPASKPRPATMTPKYLSRPSEQQAFQQQQQQEQQLDLEGPQLERPSGYSYDGPAGPHTHTSPLSPARQELLQARQRPRPPGNERLAHAMMADQGRAEPSKPSSSLPYAGQAQFQVDPAGFPVRAPPPSPAGYTASPPQHPFGSHLAGGPCRPGASMTSANEIGSSSSLQANSEPAKYRRAGEGTRLRGQFVFKVIRADSLTECELACSRASSAAGNNPADACRSFNFRAHFAAENCELSRHELRNLKLDDGSQFEQHTQFDFYALEPQLMAASGSSSSLTYAPFSDSDCLDVTQSCSQDGMEFSLRTSEPFNGRIYTYGFYDSCFFDGEGSTHSVLRISRANGFPRCGTQHLGDMMTNIVVVQFNDHVQTTRDKRYNLTCFFSGPGEAVVTSNYLDTKIDERSHPIQVEHLPPQNVITSNVHLRVLYRGQPTNTIAVGDLLTFRLETGSGRSSSAAHRALANELQAPAEIFATNVIAKDPYSGRQVQLIDARGCPLDPVNVFPELQRTPDGALESEFYAFKIPDSNFLIFQATVRTCRAPCEPVICQPHLSNTMQSAHQFSGTKSGAYLAAPPAGGTAPSWGRRRRSTGSTDEEEGDERELLVAGDSVEHVISARLGPPDAGHSNGPAQVKTITRPDLSEAEEEVKEMFRVYLSRAEMNHQLRGPRPSLIGQPAAKLGSSSSSTSTSLVRDAQPASLVLEKQEDKAELSHEVCVSQIGFYVMLFSVISLSLLTLSVLSVLLYITRTAKLDLSDSIASSMY